MLDRGELNVCVILQMLVILCLLCFDIENDSGMQQGELSSQLRYRIGGTDYVYKHHKTKAELNNWRINTKSNNFMKHNISFASITETDSIKTATLIEYEKQDKIITERLSSIRQKCSHYMQDKYWQNFRQSGDVLAYEQEHIYFCIVPKTGNTFWKRIMRFIGKDYPERQNITRPLDIDRHFVHEHALKNLQMWKVQNPISRMLMSKGKSFMFVRDPYTRLWSAYIDKFLLPDLWQKDALLIAKELRPSNAKRFDRYCANDITFSEFLQFIIKTYTKGLNNNWERLHRVCSPCHVQFDVIGKQESFRLDSEYTLTRFGLEFLKENTTKLDMKRIEITTLSKYNFDLERTIRQKCFDKIDVANRLWLAFQYNGYIDRHTPLPKSDLRKNNFIDDPTGIFTELAFKTIEQQNKLGIDTKNQKRTMMLEAYRNIPKQLLKDISHVYEYDFELFGYKKNV